MMEVIIIIWFYCLQFIFDFSVVFSNVPGSVLVVSVLSDN